MDDRETTPQRPPSHTAMRKRHDPDLDEARRTHRARLVDALNIATSVFLSHDDESLDDVVAHGLMPVADAVGIDRVAIYQRVQVEETTRFMSIYRWCRMPDDTLPAIPYLLPKSEYALNWDATLSRGECVHLRQSEMDEGEWHYTYKAGIRSMYIVPIFTRRVYWGAIALQDTTNDCYFEDDCLDLLQSAARLFAFAYIRTEAEAKTEELNKYNATMFDSAPIGMGVFGEDCKFVDSNEAFLRMHGTDKPTFLTRFFDLLPEFQPDGARSADKARDLMKRAIAGEQITMEWVHQSATGVPIPSEITLTSVIRDGKRYGLVYVYDLRYVKALEKGTRRLNEKASMTGVWERAYMDLRKRAENQGMNLDQPHGEQEE